MHQESAGHQLRSSLAVTLGLGKCRTLDCAGLCIYDRADAWHAAQLHHGPLVNNHEHVPLAMLIEKVP